MSSQRQKIVEELMKPLSQHGQGFDRDDSRLLEEYLKAAGLRPHDAEEAGREPPTPNYAEMGRVIQSFANNYSKKVDSFSQLVTNFSQELDSNISEPTSPEEDGPRRRHTPSTPGSGFTSIKLTPVARSLRRAPSPFGPPPTLPRVYAELQPRPPAPDRMLEDYDGQPIGTLDDFRVTWRLNDGFLVEDLESSPASPNGDVHPMSLLDLQDAHVHPAPEPGSESPVPDPEASPEVPAPQPPAQGKRCSDMSIDDSKFNSSAKMQDTRGDQTRLATATRKPRFTGGGAAVETRRDRDASETQRIEDESN